MTEASVAIASLRRGENEVEWLLDADALEVNGDELTLAGPVHVVATLIREGEQIEIQGRVTARARDACARCGRETGWEVDTDVRWIALPAAEGIAEGEDDAVVVHDGSMVDLTDPIRQTVAVAEPMITLCREDCAGLCPVCGTDRNEQTCTCEAPAADPRWQALSDVLKNTVSSGNPDSRSESGNEPDGGVGSKPETS